MTATDEKAQQLEKLIARIETRFRGIFITEEQWKFVVNRLTILEKQMLKPPSARNGSLLAQVKELLEENPQGMLVKELAEKTGATPNAVRGCLATLINSKVAWAESMFAETKTKEKRYSLRKYGTN